MRSFIFRSVGIAVVVSALPLAAGCFNDADDCELNPNLDCYQGTGGSSSTSTTNGGGGAGGGGDCLPVVGQAIPATCGVFVDPAMGDDANDGSRDAPKKSLALAAAEATDGKGVYVCGTTPSALTDTLALPTGVSLHGGLDCDMWVANEAGRAVIQGPVGLPVVTVGPSATNVTISGVSLEGGNGDPTQPNAQGLLVDGANVTVVRADILAGDAADGTAGDAPVGTGIAGTMGNNGGACGPAGNDGDAVTATCNYPDATMEMSTGGKGGEGQASNNYAPGDQGLPGARNNGGTYTTLCTAVDGNINGDAGLIGMPAVASAEPPAVGAGGIVLPGAVDGLHGRTGQGGGGGAGGPTNGNGPCVNRGPGGGSGGTGGCGGNGGKGGGHGGWSVAVLASGSAVITFGEGVTLTTGAGGTGGLGQPGQTGGNGGSFGGTNMNNTDACIGGVGGKGGNGGAGVSGNGGSSIGIVMLGMATMGGEMPASNIGAEGAAGAHAMGGPVGTPGETSPTRTF